MQYSDENMWSSYLGWECFDGMSCTRFISATNFSFTIANMVTYFIHRKAVDYGNPTNDFKDLNNKAFPLYKSGHINDVMYKEVNNTVVLMKALCSAEMKKAVLYKLRVVFDNNHDIAFATCGCPAGRGPTAVCKHIGALCYLVEEACRLNSTVDYKSCTSVLQTWHQPSKRKHDPCPISEVKFVKDEYGKHKRTLTSNNYDPRPQSFIGTSTQEIIQLQKQLQQLHTPVSLLHVLPIKATLPLQPIITPAPSLPLIPRSSLYKITNLFKQQPYPPSLNVIHHFCNQLLNMISHSEDDQQNIEMFTHKQSKCIRWFEEHYGRITSSNFSTFCKGAVTVAKFKLILECGTASNKLSNAAIQWGQLHEDTAYCKYKCHLPAGYQVRKAGIIIFECGFLAASPDGIVTSTGETKNEIGVIEIKCPYSCKKITVRDGCNQLKSFFCHLDENNEVRLKRNHPYYYQIQGSMAATGAQWCDFLVWTPNEFTIERIKFDPYFWNSTYSDLKKVYFNYILPELIYPRISFDLDIYGYSFSHLF